MPPRKKKTRRRRDTAISITGMAEALMLANVGTKAAFNLSAKDWLMDGWTAGSTGSALGAGQLSLHELIYGNNVTMLGFTNPQTGQQYGGGTVPQTISNTDVVMTNLRNNWMPAVIQSVAIPVGWRLGKRLLRRPINMGNKMLKQVGLRSVVKI